MKAFLFSLIMFPCLLFGGAPAWAQEVEILHYWTSGGEAAAMKELQNDFEEAGGIWMETPILGAGGDNQAAVLRSRIQAKHPPTVVQIKAANVKAWAAKGALHPLDDIAKDEQWDQLMPPVLQEAMKYQGHYYAVPINIHRTNWFWINLDLLRQVNAPVPTTWRGLFAVADKLKAAGIQPLAYGGKDWQHLTVFEAIVLGEGGADFYKKVFSDLDADALHSEKMKESFALFRRLRAYVDPNFSGRSWDEATEMLIQDQAAIQIMGDWVQGELSLAGKKEGQDYACIASPGGFILNSDSFAMFEVTPLAQQVGQDLFAHLVLKEDLQRRFNQYKGSIPARLGLSPADFDTCTQKGMVDLQTSSDEGTLVPSLAHEIAHSGAVRQAFFTVVTEFFNSDMTESEAIDLLEMEINKTR